MYFPLNDAYSSLLKRSTEKVAYEGKDDVMLERFKLVTQQDQYNVDYGWFSSDLIFPVLFFFYFELCRIA